MKLIKEITEIYKTKYVVFELEEEQYTVQFRESAAKGINNVRVFKNGKEKDVKIIMAYPNLYKRIEHIALVAKCEIKTAIKRLLSRANSSSFN